MTHARRRTATLSGAAMLTVSSALALALGTADARAEDLEMAAGNWPLDWTTGTGDWGGLRSSLADRGIEFEPSIILDWSTALTNGLEGPGTSEDAFRHLFDLQLLIDADKLMGWTGASFGIDFQVHHGIDATARTVGDFQVFSNIDAPGFTQLAEWWWQQELFPRPDGARPWLRLRIGKFDANSEFAYVENGGEFIHSSAGFSPTILGFPSYPDPATNITVFVYPSESTYLGVGVFDGATHNGCCGRTGNRGPETFFGAPDDVFLVGEGGLTWTLPGNRPGRGGIGVWHHTGSFERFDGLASETASGTYGVLDQSLWRENPDIDDDAQGIALFLQFGTAPDAVADVDRHLGAGLTWTGAIPGRDADVMGVMPSYVHFSDAARDAGVYQDRYELAVETFYKAQLCPWLSVKPDLQYIVNPGGNGAEDTLVGTVRLEALF